MLGQSTTSGTTPEQSLFPVWLVKSKVRPARQSVDILERPQLTARLNQHLNGIVTLIHAPAGYGKSTVLSGWINDLQNRESSSSENSSSENSSSENSSSENNSSENNSSESNRSESNSRKTSVCWLSLDREDNDPVQLIHYLTFALFEGGVAMSDTGINAESFPGNHSAKSLLSILVRIIESHQKEIILVLDDFENLDEATVDEIILPLLDYAPENFHLAIATRDDTNLKIANLELKGLAHRLGTDCLKFNLLELESFLSDFVDQDTIKQIYNLTEGWPVAVQLIRSAINRNTDIDRILNGINGPGNTMAAYLAQQIFESLEDEVQAFLMDISLVDRISCDLADHLRQSDDSERIFAQLKNLDALILPVENVDRTYRLHPLFREFLLKRLEYDFPDRKTQLYLLAADWYSHNGDLIQAARHYINAGHRERATALVEQKGCLNIWLTEGLARLRTIIKLIGDQVVFESPSLALINCIIHFKEGTVYRAREIYDQLLTRFELQASNSLQASDQLQFELRVVGTLLTFYEGSRFTDEFINDLKDSKARVPSDQHIMHGHFLTCLCGLHVDTGAFKLAEQYGKQAISEFEKAGGIYGKAYIYFHWGEMLFAQGKSREAEQQYAIGYNLVKRHFNDDRAMKFVVNTLQSELYYELNRENDLPKNIELLYKNLEDNEAWFNIYTAGYSTSLRCILQRQSAEQALLAVEEAFDYIEAQRLDRVKTILICQKIYLLLQSGKLDDAKAEWQNSGLNLDDYSYNRGNYIAWREREAVVQTACRLLIKEGNTTEAIYRLDYFLEQARQSGHLHSCFNYFILLTLAWNTQHEQAKALENLHQALLFSIDSGFVRAFLDEGEPIKILLDLYLAYQQDKTLRDYAAALGRCFDEQAQNTQRLLTFSDKELEILQYLEQGQANKVIARNIGISHNTVRYHLKNIFAKLNVENRSQAVSVARKRKLI